MTERPVQVSPQVYARAGGLLYLAIFVFDRDASLI